MLFNEFGARFPTTMFPDPARRVGWSTWSRSEVRRRRYHLLNDFYTGSIYLGRWGEFIRRELGLYKNVRSGISPIRQIVEFGVAHLQGGPIDPEAGPGGAVPSSLPIIPGKGASANLPGAIAGLWRASRWAEKRESFARYGLITGDTGLEIRPDPTRGVVKLRAINPHEITDCWHEDGVVRSITFERDEIDPLDRTGQTEVAYKEIITLADDGLSVLYETFRDDAPFIWPGTPGAALRSPAWSYPMPFVPVALAQNIDMDQPWGVSEIAAALQAVTEIDGQLSNLTDAKLRQLNGPMLLTGASLDDSVDNPYGDGFNDNLDYTILGGALGPSGQVIPRPAPSPGYRYQEQRLGDKSVMPFIQTDNPDAKATPLTVPIGAADAMVIIEDYRQGIRDNYPELQINSQATASGDASGRALRIYRQGATQKILQRRSSYDACLALAQRMAVAIGGHMGFPGYEGFSLASYADGTADHRIGDREVFPSDPLDVTEIQAAKADVVQKWVVNGAPLRVAMMIAGLPEADIDTYMGMIQAEDDQKRADEEGRIEELIDKAVAGSGEGAAGDGSAAKDTSNPDARPDGVNDNGAEAGGFAG